MSFKKFNAYFTRFIDANFDVIDKETQIILLSRWKKAQPALKEAMKKKPETSDLEKPKSYKTAYIMFCQAKRASILKSNPDLKKNPNEILKKMGEVWKTLSEKEKKKYEVESQKDKERFQKALEQYYEKYPDKIPQKKEKTISTKPKTSYQLFCTEHRPKLKEEGFTGKDIQTRLSLLWSQEKEKNEINLPKKSKTVNKKMSDKDLINSVKEIYKELRDCPTQEEELTTGRIHEIAKSKNINVTMKKVKEIMKEIMAEEEEDSEDDDSQIYDELDEE